MPRISYSHLYRAQRTLFITAQMIPPVLIYMFEPVLRGSQVLLLEEVESGIECEPNHDACQA
jgi:hypothetical protein